MFGIRTEKLVISAGRDNAAQWRVAVAGVAGMVLLAAAVAAQAHAPAVSGKSQKATEISSEEQTFGRQGDPKKVTRTIVIDMSDTMRFSPKDIVVKQNETVRFTVRNQGKIMHEMVIGTMEELKKHGELMKKHPGMEHDEPWMAHVKPRGRHNLVWQFTRAGNFHFACLIAGHFEAGMVGAIRVTPS